MVLQKAIRKWIVRLLGLLILSGCASNEEKAVDAHKRGTEYAFKQEFDKAITEHTEAIRLNPRYAEAYLGRGIDYSWKKEYDKAIADFNEALRLNPALGQAYYNRGTAYMQKGERAKGEADLAKAKELHYDPILGNSP